VARIYVYGSTMCLEHPNRIVNEIQSLLLECRAEAAHSSQRVGLENDNRSAIADSVRKISNPAPVRVAAVCPTSRVLAAVTAGNVVGDENGRALDPVMRETASATSRPISTFHPPSHFATGCSAIRPSVLHRTAVTFSTHPPAAWRGGRIHIEARAREQVDECLAC